MFLRGNHLSMLQEAGVRFPDQGIIIIFILGSLPSLDGNWNRSLLSVEKEILKVAIISCKNHDTF